MTAKQTALGKADRYIEENFDRFVAELQGYIRQPSVPPEDVGGSVEEVRQTAEMTAELMREVGIDSRLLETAYYPVVYGELSSKAGGKTLLIFSHYGVVSTGPREKWVADPFGAEIWEGRIISRGASDPKGNVMACFKAVEAWLETRGDVPLNLKFLFPCGEMAKSDPKFVDNYRHLLDADALLMVDAGFTRDENCPVHLGTCGFLSVDLKLATGTKDVYNIWAQLIPNAVYPLVWALASLKDSNEQVLIEGFYDDVLPPTEEELELMKSYPWQDEGELKFWGVKNFVQGVTGFEAVRRLLCEPTCSVCAFQAGELDELGGFFVPCEAMARVDFHLVPDQRPDDILEKFKAHLRKHGFGEIEVTEHAKSPPMAGSADWKIGQAIMRSAEQVGVTAYLLPHSFELWGRLGRQLGVEQALFGIADGDRKAHFPNEIISLSYYKTGIKWLARIMWEYAMSQ